MGLVCLLCSNCFFFFAGSSRSVYISLECGFPRTGMQNLIPKVLLLSRPNSAAHHNSHKPKPRIIRALLHFPSCSATCKSGRSFCGGHGVKSMIIIEFYTKYQVVAGENTVPLPSLIDHNVTYGGGCGQTHVQ